MLLRIMSTILLCLLNWGCDLPGARTYKHEKTGSPNPSQNPKDNPPSQSESSSAPKIVDPAEREEQERKTEALLFRLKHYLFFGACETPSESNKATIVRLKEIFSQDNCKKLAESITKIKSLNLSASQITEIKLLSTFDNIEELDISRNPIKSAEINILTLYKNPFRKINIKDTLVDMEDLKNEILPKISDSNFLFDKYGYLRQKEDYFVVKGQIMDSQSNPMKRSYSWLKKGLYNLDENGFDYGRIHYQTKSYFDRNGFNYDSEHLVTGGTYDPRGFDINGLHSNKSRWDDFGFDTSGIYKNGKKHDEMGLDGEGRPHHIEQLKENFLENKKGTFTTGIKTIQIHQLERTIDIFKHPVLLYRGTMDGSPAIVKISKQKREESKFLRRLGRQYLDNTYYLVSNDGYYMTVFKNAKFEAPEVDFQDFLDLAYLMAKANAMPVFRAKPKFFEKEKYYSEPQFNHPYPEFFVHTKAFTTYPGMLAYNSEGKPIILDVLCHEDYPKELNSKAQESLSYLNLVINRGQIGYAKVLGEMYGIFCEAVLKEYSGKTNLDLNENPLFGKTYVVSQQEKILTPSYQDSKCQSSRLVFEKMKEDGLFRVANQCGYYLVANEDNEAVWKRSRQNEENSKFKVSLAKNGEQNTIKIETISGRSLRYTVDGDSNDKWIFTGSEIYSSLSEAMVIAVHGTDDIATGVLMNWFSNLFEDRELDGLKTDTNKPRYKEVAPIASRLPRNAIQKIEPSLYLRVFKNTAFEFIEIPYQAAYGYENFYLKGYMFTNFYDSLFSLNPDTFLICNHAYFSPVPQIHDMLAFTTSAIDESDLPKIEAISLGPDSSKFTLKHPAHDVLGVNPEDIPGANGYAFHSHYPMWEPFLFKEQNGVKTAGKYYSNVMRKDWEERVANDKITIKALYGGMKGSSRLRIGKYRFNKSKDELHLLDFLSRIRFSN